MREICVKCILNVHVNTRRYCEHACKRRDKTSFGHFADQVPADFADKNVSACSVDGEANRAIEARCGALAISISSSSTDPR